MIDKVKQRISLIYFETQKVKRSQKKALTKDIKREAHNIQNIREFDPGSG